MKCDHCGKDDELRFGCCWDCASAGEARAARRTVLQHLSSAYRNLWRRNGNAKYDIKWAWERLTKTGDYAPNGYFHNFNIPT
jgi:hypothetical protein